MVEAETVVFNRLLPSRYYPAAVQASSSPHLNLAAMNLSRTRVNVSCTLEAFCGTDVVANAEHLPFGSSSVDIMVLSHVLEFSDHPHDVLREASQCIVSGGVLAISGFNPRSLFGAAKYTNRFAGTFIGEAHLYSVIRVRDWLALLGFEVFAGEYVFFRPPFVQGRRLNQLRSLEVAGARWWPGFGAIYILVARKRVAGFRMSAAALRKSKLSRRRLFHAVADRTQKG